MKLITDNPMLPVNALAPVAYVAVNSWVVAPLPKVPMLGATIVPCNRPPHIVPPPLPFCPLAPGGQVEFNALWLGVPIHRFLAFNAACNWGVVFFPLGINVLLVPNIGWRLTIIDIVIAGNLYDVTQNVGQVPTGLWPNAGTFTNIQLTFRP